MDASSSSTVPSPELSPRYNRAKARRVRLFDNRDKNEDVNTEYVDDDLTEQTDDVNNYRSELNDSQTLEDKDLYVIHERNHVKSYDELLRLRYNIENSLKEQEEGESLKKLAKRIYFKMSSTLHPPNDFLAIFFDKCRFEFKEDLKMLLDKHRRGTMEQLMEWIKEIPEVNKEISMEEFEIACMKYPKECNLVDCFYDFIRKISRKGLEPFEIIRQFVLKIPSAPEYLRKRLFNIDSLKEAIITLENYQIYVDAKKEKSEMHNVNQHKKMRISPVAAINNNNFNGQNYDDRHEDMSFSKRGGIHKCKDSQEMCSFVERK